MGIQKYILAALALVFLNSCYVPGGSLPSRTNDSSGELDSSGAHDGRGAGRGGFFSRAFDYIKRAVKGNWDAAINFVRNLGTSSGGLCAQKTRETLNKLFGQQRGGTTRGRLSISASDPSANVASHDRREPHQLG